MPPATRPPRVQDTTKSNQSGAPSATADDPARIASRRAAALPPEQRRQAIVTATQPLLMEHGMSVTTRQIAEAAGIAEGTIFRVFADKEALITAVVERALDPAPLEARLAEIDRAQPLADRLAEAVRILQERTVSLWHLVSNVGFAQSAAQRDDIRRRNLAVLPSLSALFEPDRGELRFGPDDAARRLRTLVIAGSHPALAGDQPLDPDEIVSLFLDGARRRTPPEDR
jgi:AcrR family transcriptional regulator